MSQTVEEVSEGILIVCLSLKGATMDHTGIGGRDASRCYHLAVCLIVSHLNEGGDVGVSDVVHATIIGTGSDALGAMVDSASTVHGRPKVCVT